MKKLLATLLLTSTGLVAANQVAAQSLAAPGQETDGWRHALGFYMFTPLSTTGTSTVNGSSAPVDLDLGDVLELLDFAASGRYEAWNGDFGVILDANYVGIEDSGTLPGPLATPYKVTSRQKWLGILGAYRVAHGTNAGGRDFSVDVQGGARWNSIKQTVTLGATTAGGDEGWVEPVVGIRGMWRLNEKWTTIASADVGGFGAGGNDLQYSVNLGLDYQPWESTALTFGYRYFSVDYSTELSGGTFAYDVEQHGPYIGVKFFF